RGDVPGAGRKGRRTRGRRAAAAEAGGLDVGARRVRNGRRDLLEDQQRPRRHASVEALAGGSALVARGLYPLAAGKEVRPAKRLTSRRPAEPPAGRSCVWAFAAPPPPPGPQPFA